jgi:hypothetical protein
VIRSFLLIRKATLEYKLRVALLSLLNTTLNNSLINLLLDSVPSTLVRDNNSSLIYLDNILLIL